MRYRDSGPVLARLPVGYERFHRRSFVNYQLNRRMHWASPGGTSFGTRPQ
jgi:hypothetical protein